MSNSEMTPKLKVTLAVSPEQVIANIEENVRTIPVWLTNLFYANGGEAIIISAGPSMEKYVEEIDLKTRMQDPDRTFKVFCVKHSLPRLLAMGIEPDLCVMLDGRDVNEASTHGVIRKDLFSKIPDSTIFLVASMSHPGYAKYLQEHGARVMGWHTHVDGVEKLIENGVIKGPVIPGGTSSGLRCISIAHALGMRDVTLIGFDSCMLNPTQEQLNEKNKKGRSKLLRVELEVKNPNCTDEQGNALGLLQNSYAEGGYNFSAKLSKVFYTTGELLAQSQDFEAIFTNPTFDIKWTVLDDGMCKHIIDNANNVVKRSKDFVSFFKSRCPRKNASGYPKRTIT